MVFRCLLTEEAEGPKPAEAVRCRLCYGHQPVKNDDEIRLKRGSIVETSSFKLVGDQNTACWTPETLEGMGEEDHAAILLVAGFRISGANAGKLIG